MDPLAARTAAPLPRPEVDELIERWEPMSEHYLHGRAELMAAVVDVLARRFGDRDTTVVELGSGPGTLLARMAQAMPTARLVGVEVDPLFHRLHQLGPAGREPGRVRVVDADLADPSWTAALAGTGHVGAVVAVQVLHYFRPERFASLLSEAGSLLSAGGVLIHLDQVPRGDGGAVATDPGPLASADEPWSTWWSAARQVPVLATALADRDRWLAAREQRSAEYHPDHPSLRLLFEHAGFRPPAVERRIGNALLTVVECPGPQL